MVHGVYYLPSVTQLDEVVMEESVLHPVYITDATTGHKFGLAANSGQCGIEGMYATTLWLAIGYLNTDTADFHDLVHGDR